MTSIGHARDKVIARASQTDFDAMAAEEYRDWLDRLPQDEFMALIGLNDEFMREGRIRPAKRIVNVEPLEPHKDKWIVYTLEEGAPPLPPNTRCWVLFPDGGWEGPNRADAFLWGDQGSAQILAYQVSP